MTSAVPASDVSVSSPDGRLTVTAGVLAGGAPFYQVDRDGAPLVLPSTLGFVLKDAPPLIAGFRVARHATRAADETWIQPWGERREVRNHYRELTLDLEEAGAAARRMAVVFRVFDDGLGFRYVLPEQPGLKDLGILDERTRFVFAGDHTAWWIPDEWDTYELLYTESPLSAIGDPSRVFSDHPQTRGPRPSVGANTPLTMRTASGLHLAIHEAALVEYAEMTLRPVSGVPYAFESALVPWPEGDKVRGTTPLRTPWRTIQVADRAGGLVESALILNLNEPSRIADTGFIEPMKYVGIWWSMHLGLTTWDRAGGRHGATTGEAKRHIDFAARQGIKGVLVEGWNTGWESWGADDSFDFQTAYPDFDLAEVTRYAREKGVEIIGHHETGGQVESYERNLEAAFALYRKHGVRAVKTGYAGPIRPPGTHQHGQWMVRHYQKVVETAARHGIVLDVHEPIKPTGLRRTWPNLMTGEAVRGQEWNAWSDGNPPGHTATVPFTRMLAGPLDYTPGVFDLTFSRYADRRVLGQPIAAVKSAGRMHTTLAKELALFVVLYSPLQMACDLPENYEGHPAFQFVRDVPVDWEETRVLSGEVGRHVTIARRGRGTRDWFVGSLTNEEARSLEIALDFLEPGQTCEATFYRDAPGAHFRDAPALVEIERTMVRAGERLTLRLAPGGGQAISLRAVPAA